MFILFIMINFFKLNKIILQTLFLIVFFYSTALQGLEKVYKGEKVAKYFSGVISLISDDYEKSYHFLKDLKDIEDIHSNYSRTYINSLVNNSKINEAFKFSSDLKKKRLNFFQSDLILIVRLIDNQQYDKAFTQLNILNQKNNKTALQELLIKTILSWIKIEKDKLNFYEANNLFDKLDPRFNNIKKIQKVFVSCYFDTPNSNLEFEKLISNKSTNFSRYSFFYIDQLIKKGFLDKAKNELNKSLEKSPRNVLLNKIKNDLNYNYKDYSSGFNCKNINNLISELFYITANALSTQSIFSISNYYLNLAKYLNIPFSHYEILLAENYQSVNNYKMAKKIYKKISKLGEAYNWHASKQLAFIYLEEKKDKEAKKILEKTFRSLKNPDLYQIFDYANFLKNNEMFEESINYYSKVLSLISVENNLYPKAKDGRGIAYERTDKWEKAEKDFLSSLEADPNQAYVINYLAYSWIEKGINIEKSLRMLEKANELRSNDGYITDSLGWALYKLKRYSKAKKYLQLAVQLMPSDPIINDHFGDCLWMTGNKLQARYYWNYVSKLENATEDQKEKIKKKIFEGPKL